MPFHPGTRQYRDFSVSNFQAREDNDENNTYFVHCYFCTFDEEYPLFEDYYESIDPHAFDECDISDVIMQVNHEGHVYARTRNGSLTLGFDNHGGIGDADIGGSKLGRECLYESVKNGLVDRMSFGFTIADDGFEYTVDSDGVYHTRITKISKLYDISAIEGFPANEGTLISARSMHDGILEAETKKREVEEAKAKQEQARAAEQLSLRRRKAKLLQLQSL